MNRFVQTMLNFRTMVAHGLDPCRRAELPGDIREHHRTLVRGVYKGARKGYKAWRRFERLCAREGARGRSAMGAGTP